MPANANPIRVDFSTRGTLYFEMVEKGFIGCINWLKVCDTVMLLMEQ